MSHHTKPEIRYLTLGEKYNDEGGWVGSLQELFFSGTLCNRVHNIFSL